MRIGVDVGGTKLEAAAIDDNELSPALEKGYVACVEAFGVVKA